MISLKPTAKPMVPPKPVSHVTPTTSASKGIYMPLSVTRSHQQEEDHYMPLCNSMRTQYTLEPGRHARTHKERWGHRK